MNIKGSTSKVCLINAALSLFKEKGIPNVTIKDICERAGCSNGTFYYNFGSMDGLFKALVQANEIINLDVLTEVLSLSTPWEKLWRIHVSFIELALSLGPDVYFRTIFQVDVAGREEWMANADQMTQLIVPIICQGQEQGEILNHTTAERLANTVGITMTGVFHHWYISNGQIDLYAYMRRELENLYDLRDDLREM